MLSRGRAAPQQQDSGQLHHATYFPHLHSTRLSTPALRHSLSAQENYHEESRNTILVSLGSQSQKSMYAEEKRQLHAIDTLSPSSTHTLLPPSTLPEESSSSSLLTLSSTTSLQLTLPGFHQKMAYPRFGSTSTDAHRSLLFSHLSTPSTSHLPFSYPVHAYCTARLQAHMMRIHSKEQADKLWRRMKEAKTFQGIYLWKLSPSSSTDVLLGIYDIELPYVGEACMTLLRASPLQDIAFFLCDFTVPSRLPPPTQIRNYIQTLKPLLRAVENYEENEREREREERRRREESRREEMEKMEMQLKAKFDSSPPPLSSPSDESEYTAPPPTTIYKMKSRGKDEEEKKRERETQMANVLTLPHSRLRTRPTSILPSSPSSPPPLPLLSSSQHRELKLQILAMMNGENDRAYGGDAGREPFKTLWRLFAEQPHPTPSTSLSTPSSSSTGILSPWHPISIATTSALAVPPIIVKGYEGSVRAQALANSYASYTAARSSSASLPSILCPSRPWRSNAIQPPPPGPSVYVPSIARFYYQSFLSCLQLQTQPLLLSLRQSSLSSLAASPPSFLSRLILVSIGVLLGWRALGWHDIVPRLRGSVALSETQLSSLQWHQQSQLHDLWSEQEERRNKRASIGQQDKEPISPSSSSSLPSSPSSSLSSTLFHRAAGSLDTHAHTHSTSSNDHSVHNTTYTTIPSSLIAHLMCMDVRNISMRRLRQVLVLFNEPLLVSAVAQKNILSPVLYILYQWIMVGVRAVSIWRAISQWMIERPLSHESAYRRFIAEQEAQAIQADREREQQQSMQEERRYVSSATDGQSITNSLQYLAGTANTSTSMHSIPIPSDSANALLSHAAGLANDAAYKMEALMRGTQRQGQSQAYNQDDSPTPAIDPDNDNIVELDDATIPSTTNTTTISARPSSASAFVPTGRVSKSVEALLNSTNRASHHHDNSNKKSNHHSHARSNSLISALGEWDAGSASEREEPE